MFCAYPSAVSFGPHYLYPQDVARPSALPSLRVVLNMRPVWSYSLGIGGVAKLRKCDKRARDARESGPSFGSPKNTHVRFVMIRSMIFVVLRSPPQPFSPGRCTTGRQNGITASQLSLLSACDAIVTLTSWPNISVLPSLKWACETTTWIAWCHTRSGAHHGIHRIFSITSSSVWDCCLISCAEYQIQYCQGCSACP